jgi:hypothetical protein
MLSGESFVASSSHSRVVSRCSNSVLEKVSGILEEYKKLREKPRCRRVPDTFFHTLLARSLLLLTYLPTHDIHGFAARLRCQHCRGECYER